MAEVVFLKKEHLGSGNFEWTFRCRCENGDSSPIKVTSGNENVARNLAQIDCEASCGEAKRSTLRHEYAGMTRELQSATAQSSAFVVWVNEVTDDAYVVSLCSGDEIIVPREMVRRFRPLGRSLVAGAANSNISARLEFDLEAPGALTVVQLATALERELGGVPASTDVTKGQEVCQQVKILVNGPACQNSFGYYFSAYPLTGAELARTENCQAGNLTRIGQTQVRFVHSGLPGTPCTNSYNGAVYLDVCWLEN